MYKHERLGGQFREVLLCEPQESKLDESEDNIDDDEERRRTLLRGRADA